MGDAGVFLQADSGSVCGAQRAHRVLSNAFGGESVRERPFEIRDGQRIDPVSDGQATAAGVDPQDHEVPGARKRGGRRELENVKEVRRESMIVGLRRGAVARIECTQRVVKTQENALAAERFRNVMTVEIGLQFRVSAGKNQFNSLLL